MIVVRPAHVGVLTQSHHRPSLVLVGVKVISAQAW